MLDFDWVYQDIQSFAIDSKTLQTQLNLKKIQLKLEETLLKLKKNLPADLAEAVTKKSSSTSFDSKANAIDTLESAGVDPKYFPRVLVEFGIDDSLGSTVTDQDIADSEKLLKMINEYHSLFAQRVQASSANETGSEATTGTSVLTGDNLSLITNVLKDIPKVGGHYLRNYLYIFPNSLICS